MVVNHHLNTFTFRQLLKKGLWFLCISTVLPSEFWREVAPRILKACRVLLRSPKLQLLGTLLGLSSRLGSILGERRRTWTPPRLPGPPGTPGPTAGETPEPTVGTTGEERDTVESEAVKPLVFGVCWLIQPTGSFSGK